MANFLLIHDPDPTRRSTAAATALRRAAFLPRLRGGIASGSGYAVAWAAAPHAPVEHHRASGPDGHDCWLLGEPHDAAGVRIGANALAGLVASDGRAATALDGYYAAILVHPESGVLVEADVLGMCPVYHWASGDVLLVGSSPELFRCHPAFSAEMDLHGAAALLLTSGIVGGRTLWRGVHRLGADARLIWRPGQNALELPPERPEADIRPRQLDDAVAEAATLHLAFLRGALQRSAEPGLLLSGGLDSRLLAGLLGTLGHRPACLTFGGAGDLDAACAAGVARTLGLRQTVADIEPEDYGAHAESSVRWEQLSGGLYAVPLGWNVAVRRPTMAIDRIVCGLTLDAVIGGPKHVARAAPGMEFEELRIGRLGFDRLRLEPLLGSPELAQACDDVRDELVREYLAGDGDDAHREWRMNLAHRHRFAVGACAWRYSLYCWPVMPALDRRLIALARQLPYAVMKDRQVQIRLLVTRYPALARLELDRNYIDTAPLLGARRSVWFDVRRRATKLRRRCQVWLGRDPRFYVRAMDFNGPGWRRVREAAEEARPAARALFRGDVLDQLLPPPNSRVRRLRDPIIHSTPLKNTLGLMLWLRQHA